MTSETFTGPGGAWDVAANWSGGSVPQPGDDVSLPGSGGTPTNMVTISASDAAYTVGSLDIDPGAAQPLYVPDLIDAGTLTATGSTTLANGGQIEVGSGGVLNLLGVTVLLPNDGASPAERITVDASGKLTIGTLGGAAGGGITVTNGFMSIGTDSSATAVQIVGSARVTVAQFEQSGQSDGTGTLFGLDGGTLAIGAVGANFMANIQLQTRAVTAGNPSRLITEYVGGAIDATTLPYQAGEILQVSQKSQSIGPYGYAFTDSYAVQSPQGQTLFTLGNVFTSTDPALPVITLSDDLAGGTLSRSPASRRTC